MFLEEKLRSDSDYINALQERALIQDYTEANAFFHNSTDFTELYNVILDYRVQIGDPNCEECLIDYITTKHASEITKINQTLQTL